LHNCGEAAGRVSCIPSSRRVYRAAVTANLSNMVSDGFPATPALLASRAPRRSPIAPAGGICLTQVSGAKPPARFDVPIALIMNIQSLNPLLPSRSGGAISALLSAAFDVPRGLPADLERPLTILGMGRRINPVEQLRCR
jgi:hypothetical protein